MNSMDRAFLAHVCDEVRSATKVASGQCRIRNDKKIHPPADDGGVAYIRYDHSPTKRGLQE